jgi:hypothetical protein
VASTLREVNLTGRNLSRSITVEVLVNDEESSDHSGAISFTDSAEAEYGTAVFGTDTWVADRRRERRLSFRRTGDWHQLKITHSTKNTKLDLAKIEVGLVPKGNR